MPFPPTPALATDSVVFDAQGRVLLIRRKYPPSQGGYALPGGFVDMGETVEAACRRELMEETGIEAGGLNSSASTRTRSATPAGTRARSRSWRASPRPSQRPATMRLQPSGSKTGAGLRSPSTTP